MYYEPSLNDLAVDGTLNTTNQTMYYEYISYGQSLHALAKRTSQMMKNGHF